jgi:enoyl-CoA hydratase
MGADEAERCGLVSRVVREGSVVDKAVEVAEEVARLGRVAVQAGKEAVNAGEYSRIRRGPEAVLGTARPLG